MEDHPLKISTWNVDGAFSSHHDRRDEVLHTICASDSDVVILPDAWHENSESSRPSRRRLEYGAGEFRRLGYTMLKSTYYENRPDNNYAKNGCMTLIRSPHAPLYDTFRLGSRPAHHLRFEYGETVLNVIGLNLTDQHEVGRNEQLDILLRYLDHFESEPMILAGRFNAMHRDTTIAKLLSSRALGPILNFPIANDAPLRLREMAHDSTMEILQAEDFVDIDPRRQPTTPTWLPLFQLDRIMVRNGLNAPLRATQPEITADPFLSPHAMVTSTVTLSTRTADL